MSPDTLPVRPPLGRDTRADQSPPPLMPSQPAGLWGRWVVIETELCVLVRGELDGVMERRTDREKMRGGEPKHSRIPGAFSSLGYISSFMSFWQRNAHAGTRCHPLSTDHFYGQELYWGAELIQSDHVWPNTSAGPCSDLRGHARLPQLFVCRGSSHQALHADLMIVHSL